MRQDIYSVVRQAARTKGRDTAPRVRRLVDGEYLYATHESMRRPHRLHYRGKESHLHLAPLKRFIASRVGQPWNQVFGELKQSLRKRDSVLDDPMRYLDVEVKTSLRDGEVVAYSRFGVLYGVAQGACEYYVDPQTGNLCSTNRNQGAATWRRESAMRRKEAVDARRKEVSDSIQLHLCKGIWFEVYLAALPDAREVAAYQARSWGDRLQDIARYDVVLERKVYGCDEFSLRNQYGAHAGALYAQSKRQLSHRELKAHGLLDPRPL